MHPNDIPVLAKIFNPNTQYIFIAKKDFQESKITDTLACQIISYDSPQFIEEILKIYPVDICTLVHTSTTPPYYKNLTTLQLGNLSYPATSRHWINLKVPRLNLSSDGKSLDKQEYSYINNPDGTIRWLYPAEQKQPTFLHLYNTSGWKGKLIRKGIEAGFKCGLGQRIKQGSIQVYAPYAPVGGMYQQSATLFNSSDFAIFTGTKGENRKAVIVFEKNKKATHFLKVPLTTAATTLVRNEGEQLKQLSQLSLNALVVPMGKRIHQFLLQTNIRPAHTRSNLTISNLHLEALRELYQDTTEWKLIQQTTAWAAIEKDVSELENPTIKNDLSPAMVQQVVIHLKKVQSQMDTTLPIPIALAHGDFTPWNTYLTNKQLMVYDWELAASYPLLFDAFHFIFQSSILIKRQSFVDIKKQVERLRQHPIVQELQRQSPFSFDDSYRFYLLHTISYYLNRYIQQSHLHEQAHWLVATWKEALIDCSSNKKLVAISTPMKS